MIYSNNSIYALNEKTEGEVKLAVAFEKFKKWFLGQEMDTDKIDKMIREIENCNHKINKYRDDPNKENEDKLVKDKTYVQKIIKECFWLFPSAYAMGAAPVFSGLLGAIVAGMYILLVNSRLSEGVFFNNLIAENNKALNWLKEEKDVIEFKKSKKDNNKEVQNEGTIFESVSMI